MPNDQFTYSSICKQNILDAVQLPFHDLIFQGYRSSLSVQKNS